MILFIEFWERFGARYKTLNKKLDPFDSEHIDDRTLVTLEVNPKNTSRSLRAEILTKNMKV